jgi:outer membrane protein OmpA-like peptidoglycan-associated protein
MRRLLVVLALLGAAPLRAQVVDLVFKTDDLVFTVVDTGAKIEDLSVKESDTEVRIDLAADVLFDFDKADLLPNAEATLQKAADLIKQRATKSVVRIEGHTDAKGNDAYNQKLSERRAGSVKRWFESHGLHERFSTAGFGAKKPVAPNTKPDGSDDPEGRAKNRRVEIVITKS